MMKIFLGVIAALLILSGSILRADISSGSPSTGKPVPEPEAYVFFGLGALGLIATYRRKNH